MQEQINFEIKSNVRSKYIRIAVFPDGRVVLSKPARMPEAMARHFAARKLPWIRKRLDYYRNTKFHDWKDYTPASRADVLAFVKSRIEHFNQHYKFQMGKVSIKDHKNIWGSCSVRKNLNFNSKIIALPEQQSDYIIVHELCHLAELNHSRNFWKLVAQQIPDYKRIKKALKLFSFY